MARRAQRRSSRRRSSRLRRNDAPPVTVAAQSSKKKKLLVLGIGVVAVGGVAAYAMSASAAAPPPPTGPTVDPRTAKAAECAALQNNLVALRAQPTPDGATMTRLEGEISACLAQARELGAEVDAATTQLAAADAVYTQMEGWFHEYRATSSDPLKRNNTRQTILNGGASIAAAYTNAIAQSTNPQMTKLIAQSVRRALDSAISRQLCYLGNERGCGTSGSDEDQPDAKAAQEQSRVIAPLIAAYMQAVAKLGGPGQALANADGEQFLTTMLRPCTFLKGFIDGQFAHYRATDSGFDPLKRNNTRRDILASGSNLAACLRGVFTTALSFKSTTSMRAVAALTLAAINSSIDRWSCFFTNGSGCGTFAVSEDQPDVKAAQEQASVTVPLFTVYAQIARALVASGDVNAYGPLITAKLRICSTMKSFIDGQFSHYKATEWSDALKRNNTRQSMLATGASLAACLQGALTTAVAAGTPGGALSGLGGLGLHGMGGYVSEGSGLGQVLTYNAAFVPTRLPASIALAAPKVNVAALVRPIATLIASALDAAIQRKICYLYDQAGCGRFGVNEDHGNDKALQEQIRVIAPLLVVAKQAVAADASNAQAETPFTQSLLREVKVASDLIDSQYSSLKATDYVDGLKRSNIRGSIIQAGAPMVIAFRNMRPTTPAGRKLARDAAAAALAKSRTREACYRAEAPGCGRISDEAYGSMVFFSGGAYATGGREDHGGVKADQERDQIGNPLAALVGNTSATGLGGGIGDVDAFVLPTYAWVGLGLLGGAYALGAFSRKPVRNSKRRRRTSRRLSA